MSNDSEGDSLERELKEYLEKVKSFLHVLKDDNLNAKNEATRKELVTFFDNYYKQARGGYSDDEDDDGPLYEEIGVGGNVSFNHEAITVNCISAKMCIYSKIIVEQRCQNPSELCRHVWLVKKES